MIDKNTYGDSPAEITLANIIVQKNNPKLTRYVGAFLNEISLIVNGLSNCPMDVRRKLYTGMKKEIFRRIDDAKIIQANAEINSYFKNSAIKRFRKLLRTPDTSRLNILLSQIESKHCKSGHRLKEVGRSGCDDVVECPCGKWIKYCDGRVLPI